MPGSGPGGRWFKSTRPDHSFENQLLTSRHESEELLVDGLEVSGPNPLALTFPFNHLRCFVLLQIGSIWVQQRIGQSHFRHSSLRRFGMDVL